MAGGRSNLIRSIHFAGDITLLNFSFVVSYLFLKGVPEGADREIFGTLLAFLNLSWVLIVMGVKLYEIHRLMRMEQIFRNIIKGVFLHILLFSSLVFIMNKQFHAVDQRVQLLLTYLLFSALLSFWRIIFINLLKLYRRAGINYREVAIIGGGPVGTALMEFFSSDQSYGYHFNGFFDDNPEKCVYKEKVIGRVEDVKAFVEQKKLDELYCALPDTAATKEKVRELMEFSEDHMVRFKIVPDFMRFIPKKVTIDFYGNNSIPIILLRTEPLQNLGNRIVKRIFDFFFSLLVIFLLLSWVIPIIGLMIIINSRGPIFFRQKRSGEKNRIFTCWKFRTMTVNKDADSIQSSIGDARITKFGAFLRKTNLDELPQFLNVLVGDMSVIGPRPHMLKHTEEYSKIIHKYMVRHLIKPGITGWAQVNGFRGETKDPQKMKKRVQYDVWYIENWAFLLDIKIIFLTVWNMVKGEDNAQ